MKVLTIVIMMLAMLVHGTALAQPAPEAAPADNPSQPVNLGPLGTQAYQTCVTSMDQSEACSQYGLCTQGLVDAAATCTEQINDAVQTCGYQNQDAACRARHGVVRDNTCVCEAGRQWNNPEEKTCCVTNPARYEQRRKRCEDSGGTFRCSQRGDGGWCFCPLGMLLNEHGMCEGEAVGRQRIQEMRDDIAGLTAERDRLQARIAELERELRTAESEGDQLQADLEAARQELAAVRRYLDFLRDILAARGIETPSEAEVADGMTGTGSTMPSLAGDSATTPSDSLPGARESAAQVAAEATYVPPSQVGATNESEESWCERNPVPCGFIIAGAVITAAGLGVGLYEALKPPPEVTIGFDYNR